MRVIFDHDRAVLFHGDSGQLDLPENSVDAIVCDPPSGISFMNKGWDTDHGGRDAWIDWLAATLAPAFRALKPGGHGLFWALPRTSHWTGLALEKLGFEIRDRVSHIFLSGFPKNLDVAKQIDKSDAASERRRRALAFTTWMRSTGLTAAQINEITGTTMASHYLTDKEQPQVATREHLDAIQVAMPTLMIPDEIQELVGHRTVLSEQFAKRLVIGVEIMQDTSQGRPGFSSATYGGTGERKEVAITTAYTENAKRWEGWGTALKPAVEDWWLVRKPPEDSIAANVLEYGTGAINVGGCRIGDEVLHNHPARNVGGTVYELGVGAEDEVEGTTAQGRWPTHLIIGDEVEINDVPEPAKYFYCPKPPKSETEAGLDHLPVITGAELTGRKEGSAGLKNPRAGAGAKNGARNIHPTKKPIALMNYLIKLICPPGGVVLDPFAGSGTTGVAALRGGWSFVGCEQGGGEGDPYLPILIGRIRHALGLPGTDPLAGS